MAKKTKLKSKVLGKKAEIAMDKKLKTRKKK